MSKQAIIYARFSDRPDKDECMSNEKQEELCMAYCHAYALEVDSTYRDAAISGKEAANRPGLQAALKHVCKIKGAFVVYDLSRLTRDIIDGAVIERRLRKKGAALMSVTEHIDCSHYTGRFVYHVLLGVAQMERERIAERTSQAMLYYQKNGRRMSNLPPYGWKVDPIDDSLIVQCHIEQRHIELIRAFAERGAGLREIARLLAANGIRSRTGNGWHHSQIQSILSREGDDGSASQAL